MTIKELLQELDGAGLIITDDDIIDEALEEMGIDGNTEIPEK